MMPKIAEGDANKVWIIPSEITKALEGLGSSIHEISGIPQHSGGPRVRVDMGSREPASLEGSGALADAECQEGQRSGPSRHRRSRERRQPGRGRPRRARALRLPPPPAPPAS